jgi:hypothetical protein
MMGIIRRPVFYLNHEVSWTGLCLCLQVEPTQLDLGTTLLVLFLVSGDRD